MTMRVKSAAAAAEDHIWRYRIMETEALVHSFIGTANKAKHAGPPASATAQASALNTHLFNRAIP